MSAGEGAPSAAAVVVGGPDMVGVPSSRLLNLSLSEDDEPDALACGPEEPTMPADEQPDSKASANRAPRAPGPPSRARVWPKDCIVPLPPCRTLYQPNRGSPKAGVPAFPWAGSIPGRP